MLVREQEIQAQRVELERQRQALQAQISALQVEFVAKEHQMQRLIDQAQQRARILVKDEETMSRSRSGGSINGRKAKGAGGER